METSIWDLPVQQAHALHNAAYVVLIVGAVLIALSTVTIFWTSGVRDRFANLQLAEADSRTNMAKADVAKANVKIAELGLEIQQARLEQERLKAQMGWRRISADQYATIVAALKNHPMTIFILCAGDPEARQFAGDLEKTLRDAGATVNFSLGFLPNPVKGLAMTMTTSADGSLLYAALRSAGLAPQDLPQKDRIMIVVGSKPAPF